MKLGSSGGTLRACRCGGMGARELESRAAGAQMWMYGAREFGRRADVEA